MLYTAIFHIFNVLLDKSICLRTVKLYVVQLIVMLLHLTTITELILHFFKVIVLLIKLDRMMCFADSSYFLHISRSFTRTQVKSLIVILKLLPRKTLILGISLTFLPLIAMFPIKITQYCGKLGKVVGATLCNPDYPTLL